MRAGVHHQRRSTAQRSGGVHQNAVAGLSQYNGNSLGRQAIAFLTGFSSSQSSATGAREASRVSYMGGLICIVFDLCRLVFRGFVSSQLFAKGPSLLDHSFVLARLCLHDCFFCMDSGDYIQDTLLCFVLHPRILVMLCQGWERGARSSNVT